MLLRNVVEESGFHSVVVNELAEGKEAILAFTEAHQPSAILFDIPWPFDRNLEDYLEMRADPRAQQTRWLALSTSDHVIDELKAKGEVTCLGKPFDLEELMETLGRLVAPDGITSDGAAPIGT